MRCAPAASRSSTSPRPCTAAPRSSSCRRRSRNASPFALTEISRFDERGPAWYWNDISTSEHTGTHFDAPEPLDHRAGRRGRRVRSRPPSWSRRRRCSTSPRERAKDPDFLLEVEHVRAWEAEHGPLPDGGWLLYRTGWDARSEDPGGLPERRRDRPAHPGHLGRVRAVAGRGGAGDRARRRDRRHRRRRRPLLRPRRSRATPTCSAPASTGSPSCRTSPRLPPTGAVVIAGPLPIVSGSGSPARVLALVERMTAGGRASSGRTLAGLGVGHAVRRRRQRQLPRHERAARRRGPVRRGPARERRRDDGRRLGPHDRAPSPSLTVHQGCGLTNAMTGIAEAAKSRTPLLVLAAEAASPSVQLPHRPGRAGRRRRRGARAGARRPALPPRDAAGPTGRPSSSGAPSCSTCRWTCRPRRPPARRCAAVPRPRPGPARRGASDGSPRAARDRGAPGVRRRPRRAGAAAGGLRALGAASGALLATSRRRARPVRRRPLVARRSPAGSPHRWPPS